MTDYVPRGDSRTLTYRASDDLSTADTVQWVAVAAPGGAPLIVRPAVVEPGPVGAPSVVTVDLRAIDTDRALTGALLCRIIAVTAGAEATYPDDGYESLWIVDDLSPATDLLVTEADVMAALGGINDPTTAQINMIRAAIRAVQADITTYLGVPLVPSTATVVLPNAYYGIDPAIDLPDYIDPRDFGYVGNPDGSVTVTFTYGYDAANDVRLGAAVRRYILYAVIEQPRIVDLWRTSVGSTGAQRIKSASTNGQSVTYEQVGPTGEVIGSRGSKATDIVDLSTLSYWRVAGRRVHQRRGYGSDPMPRDTSYFVGGWR